MKLAKKLLWTFPIMILFVSMTMANVAMASPETHFWVYPPVVEETPYGSFLITVNIAEAPDTYAWTISLSWDPDLLELAYIAPGDFLEGIFVYDGGSLDEANLEGHIMIGCSLLGDPTIVPWVSGDGTLCNLGFIAQAEGSCVLDLFNTVLYGEPLVWDEEKQAYYPTPQEYDATDVSITTTLAYACSLTEWKLKVNNAAGKGKGHKSTVNATNLLEAYVNNTGNFDIDVQAYFEVRDSAGYWVATVPSSIEPLPAGQSTILSATWTADTPGHYYITAYLFHSAPPLVPNPAYPNLIPDGFSGTFRLRVDLRP